jgi:hypothetical protein
MRRLRIVPRQPTPSTETTMPAESAPLNRIPPSTVGRWAMKAAVLGLFTGVAAGIAALLAG